MVIFFFIVLLITAVLYAAGKNQYSDYIEPVDEKMIPLKRFLPIGLYLMGLTGYKYASAYDRGLLTKLSCLHSAKYARYYLTIHWAQKVTLELLLFLFIGLIGALSTPNKEFAVFCLLLVAGGFFLPDRELQNRIKKRQASLQMDFPVFVNKLTLLINAGMTVSRAWEKVVTDAGKDTPLYLELEMVLADIRAGKPEHRAYEDFAKRCRVPEITRFISVILQNIRRGGTEIVPILRVHANECWEMRKNTAKRLGEEASTRMLLPMVLMFLAILLIVGTPAVLVLRGM